MRPSGLCLWLMLLYSVGYTQAQTGIIAAEYFFDVDPGVGAANSIPITPGLDTLDVSALQVSFSNAVPGMHFLVVRVLHAQYGWGIGASGSIFVTDSSARTVSLQPAPVVWAEYFFWQRSWLWKWITPFDSSRRYHHGCIFDFLRWFARWHSSIKSTHPRFARPLVFHPIRPN